MSPDDAAASLDDGRLPRLRADKRLGQHFLLDPAILKRIADAAGDIAGRRVVEVGPGPGGLTRALLEVGADLVAIERDPRYVPLLEPLRASYGPRLKLIEADALEIRIADFTELGPVTVVANLPYNIATPLLLRWLDELQHLAAMHLMFQDEVAERLTAVPGTAAYGRLSVLVQLLCRVRRRLRLPAGAFHPPPKVASALVTLEPRDDAPAPHLRAAVEAVTRAAFAQRRKMLRSSLRPLAVELEALFERAGAAPTARAGEIAPLGYLRLAAVLLELRRAAAGTG